MSRMMILLPLIICLISSCGTKEQVNNATDDKAFIREELEVISYSEKLKGIAQPQLIDVRTAEEFSGGHLTGALNYDINSSDFETRIAKLGKTKPVFVYCLSGGRSASAAEILTEKGFREVYNMSGGIMKWDAAGLPLDAGETQETGMSLDEFNKLISSGKEFVLIDFNATWCKPCKKMAPWLEEVSKRNASNLTFIKIDADKNKSLLEELGISAIPVLQLYQEAMIKWQHQAEISETDFLKETELK